jgi:O-antigen ligase
MVSLYLAWGHRTHTLVTLALALAFFLTPAQLALFWLAGLGLALLLRPDLGLVLVSLTLSFFPIRKTLPFGDFSAVELLLIVTGAAFICRYALTYRAFFYPAKWAGPLNAAHLIAALKASSHPLKSADGTALALVGLGLLATLAAENFGVSMLAWRTIVLEPVLFYYLIRLRADYDPRPPARWRWAWRLVDAFVAGAVLQAGLALYLYALAQQTVAVDGVRRAIGLSYSSPNNLALFLDRAWPLLLVVAISPGLTWRHWLYRLALIIVSLALYLTFSKGALFIGLPAGLITMLVLPRLAGRPPSRPATLGLGAALLTLLIGLIPFSQTPRFQDLLALGQGNSGFFRLNLWRAALTMIQEHWLLGLGLNNFLYQYRTRYILPEAWQEPNLSHPHNLILDVTTQLGIAGLLIFIGLQSAFWSQIWSLYRRTQPTLILGLSGTMAVIIGHGLVDHAYFLVDLSLVYFLITGLGQSLNAD